MVRLAKQLSLATAAAAALVGAQLGLGATLSGCGETGGKRITLSTEVVVAQGATQSFFNDHGWQIQFTQAYLSVGALYYFTGPPVVAHNNSLPHWKGFLTIPTAHAHPGHYSEGDALGEMVEPQTINLLDPDFLAPSEAVTGHYESARFTFQNPPEGELAPMLESHVILIEGQASKENVTISFRATADESDILNADGNPFVEGCVFKVVDIESSGKVTLTIHPEVWFDQVDFSLVSPSENGEPVNLTPGEIPHKAFVRGLKKGTAYDFAFVADSSPSN
ncbi:MAG: hypothetical protein IPK82_05140 [Polyangiaceae bacterium]|nr:hypothetical protein [Polyangiaceae bacterium]